MKSNRLIIRVSILITLLSGILLFVFKDNDVGLSVCASLFAGGLVGLIVPTASFLTIKKQLEIEFYTICVTRFNQLKNIANWFTHNHDNINYEHIYPINPKNENENVIKQRLIAIMDDTIKEGLRRVVDFADSDNSRFFAIIDDYCGMFFDVTKSKKQMFIIRDIFAKYNYYYLNNKNTIRSIAQMDFAFNGDICFKDALLPYFKETEICDRGIECVRVALQSFLLITKIEAYSRHEQGKK